MFNSQNGCIMEIGSWNDWSGQVRIEYSIVGMIGLGRLELNIQ